MSRIAILLASLTMLAACGGGGGNNSGGNSSPGGTTGGTTPPAASNTPFWPQWGANPQHSGLVAVAGQSAAHQLADIVYDPFVAQAQAESGADLLSHYPAPVIDANDVYVVVKSGTYTSCNPVGSGGGANCGPNAWSSMIRNAARFTWVNNVLSRQWTFQSNRKPATNGSGWEPVFHPVDANDFLYVPGAGGTIWKVNKTTGVSTSHIQPFTAVAIDATNSFVSSPLTADSSGNIYYNVIQLAPRSAGDPWAANDVVNSWLVKVTSADATSIVTYATLTPTAPAATSTACPGRFTNTATLPWPPSPTAVPPTVLCGSQRPGMNIAPAMARDGTVYTASRAHFDARVTFLVAVNPNLTLKWASTMQNLLNDGCAAYTPLSIASDGKLYTQNDGHLFAVGN